ncbi:MAG: ATP-dependent sacrificial sulfur transferase LarE [Halanaerobiales bacterium]
MMEKKYEKLQQIINKMGRVLVAFSGGVDSTFLLRAALDSLGRQKVLAVTADSPIRFSGGAKKARQLAEELKVEHRVIETRELEDEDFLRNDRLRCYYCKRELYGRLTEIAAEEGIPVVLDATNAEESSGDYRPGLRALQEYGIESPLKTTGWSKMEIRNYSRKLDLPTWDQPSDSCLATRVTYNLELNSIRLEKLRRIEEYLQSFNFKQLRARLHDEHTIRIEVLPEEMEKIMDNREEICQRLKKEDINYITLDLEGYRSGSMNDILEEI